jgi:S1-C subfamily serine protease
MVRKNNLSKPAMAILLLLVVVFGSMTVYYSLSLASANSNIQNLQSSGAALKVKNTELQRILSAEQSQGNASLMSLNPVAIYDRANRSVVTVQGSRVVTTLTFFGPQSTVESVLGSGFVVKYSNAYYVVTNFHVVDSLVNVTVTFWNGDAYRGNVVGSDAYSDLAILSTGGSMTDFSPLDFGLSSGVRVGQPVMAIGNPYGLSGSVTFGIISQVGRSIQYQSSTSTFTVVDAIQFSAPINPGNSGGPLLNAFGQVVGITSAAVTGAQAVGFAIPSDTILRELPLLITTGRYGQHPYFGLQAAADMNFQLAQAMGSNVTYGVLIERTNSGGPADKAGIRGGQQVVTIDQQQYLVGGDIIVSLNGKRIVNYDSFAAFLEEHSDPGGSVQVGIIRAGAPMIIQVTVGAQPAQ